MAISFEKQPYNVYFVKGDDWYINDERVMLGSVGQSEEDSFYYFTPSGHMLYGEQLIKVAEKLNELNYSWEE